MFIIRALFWFAVVAILMPPGPNLGLDLDQLRAELATQPVTITRPEAIASLRSEIAAARVRAEDPVRILRDNALQRLSQVRVELAESRPAGGQARSFVSARNPLF